MHFSHINNSGGSKAAKFAMVAGFHIAVGAVFVHSLGSRHFQMPKMADALVVMLTPEPPPLPTPPEPSEPVPQTAPPQIVAPPIEVQVQQVAPLDVVTAFVSADSAPQPATATPQTQIPTPPAASAASASPNTAAIRSAVLADANGCIKPDYPARAARNGESGSVTLALLVDVDGRVAGSRIERSSGSRELDKAAVAALSMCKFKPATNGGVAEQAWAQIAYVWTLEQ